MENKYSIYCTDCTTEFTTRQIFNSYTVEKMGTMSAKLSSSWRACVIKGTVLPINQTVTTFLCRRSFGALWFADGHEYCACHCNFVIVMPMNSQLTQTFVGCHNVEVFALPLRDCPVFYVVMPDWWVGWELSHLVLGALQSIFAYHSCLICVVPARFFYG